MSSDPARSGFIPLSVPHLAGNEWAYVRECIDSGWVSSVGSFVERFEQQFSQYLGAPHAVAVVNGTAALHVALLLAGVKPDDEVLVSTLTFIAPANAIRYAGAYPVFIDADPAYWQMDANCVRRFLQKDCLWKDGSLRNRSTGRRVAAILPVHILGHPVDLDPILECARQFLLPVIEDATESLGACYQGQRLGLAGDIACFSFNGNKIMTAGGGGMIVTRREDWATRARYLTTQAKKHPVEYIHHEIGFNYRLTNIQAALGCAQLEQMESFLARKRQIARAYSDAFAALPGIQAMPEAPWAQSSFWLYTILVNPQTYGQSSRQLLERLAAARIQSRPLWQPIHRSPAHRDGVHLPCDEAERLYDRALSLPSSTSLTPQDQDRVIKTILHQKP